MSTQDIHLFVFDSLSDWEAAYAIAGINNPQFHREDANFRIRTVAPKRTPSRQPGAYAFSLISRSTHCPKPDA